jgi:hypothetical protein
MALPSPAELPDDAALAPALWAACDPDDATTGGALLAAYSLMTVGEIVRARMNAIVQSTVAFA